MSDDDRSQHIRKFVKDVCSIENLVKNVALSCDLVSCELVPLKSVARNIAISSRKDPRFYTVKPTDHEIRKACCELGFKIYDSRQNDTTIELNAYIHRTELIIAGLRSEPELIKLASKLSELSGSKIVSSVDVWTNLGKLSFDDLVQTIVAWRILHLIQIDGRGFQAALPYTTKSVGRASAITSVSPARAASSAQAKSSISIEKRKPGDNPLNIVRKRVTKA
jgi:hypothetical protein